jgi:hypothetical protein
MGKWNTQEVCGLYIHDQNSVYAIIKVQKISWLQIPPLDRDQALAVQFRMVKPIRASHN